MLARILENVNSGFTLPHLHNQKISNHLTGTHGYCVLLVDLNFSRRSIHLLASNIALEPRRSGHCGNQRVLDIIDPILWILTDFAILFAPLPMVYKLHIPIRQRLALGVLFLVGGL